MSGRSGVDPSRQVPKGLSDTDKIYGYSTEEITTVVVIAFIGMVLTNLIPQSLSGASIFVLLGSILFGILVVFVTPNHLEPTEWLGSMGHYFARPTKVPHLSLADGMAREQKDVIEEAKVYELNERTQEITWVRRVHKDAQAIERIDDAVVGGIKVEPANMALASEEKWERMIDSWQSYLDHTLEYPVQIYATSEPFPVDDYIDHYQSRVNDPDLQERPIMQELLRDFLDWYPEYLQYQGTNQKEYYLIFAVEPHEVVGSELEEEGVVEQLSDIPGLGTIVSAVFGGDDEEEGVARAKQFAELDNRIREARNQGIRPLQNCSSRRLSGFELAVLLKEYWQGRITDFEDERTIGSQGLSYRSNEDAVSPEETATGNTNPDNL